MSFQDWKNVLRQAAALGCETVRFIGGEPTAYLQLADLIAYAREIGFKNVFLYTNGIHLTVHLQCTLVEYNVGLAFSLYAATPALHDAVTLVPGSFTKTIDSIQWAVNMGLRVKVSITRIAGREEIDAAARMVRRMGVRVVTFDRVRRIGRGGGDAPCEDVNELCGSCWRGKLCISPSGTIYPCVFSRFRPVGSVKDGIAEVVGCKALRNFREEVYAVDQWRHIGPMAMTCSPEEDPGPCNPEQDPGPCSPEQDPGPCNPEQDPGPCDPEKDPGPCDPESNPG